MRNALVAALLVPILALASTNLQPRTTVDAENGIPGRTLVERVDGNREPSTSVVLVGTVDTIGGTTYDWQANGPSLRWLVNSPDYGLHALWMYSSSNETTFPDRNMRYNFYDYAAGGWNWIDPVDFMQSGVNVFTDRCGYGNLDACPSTGVAMVSSHIGEPIHPDVARDLSPGAGIFEYCTGTPVMDAYLWPFIAADQNSRIHCHCIDDASRNMVFYSKVDPWCTWANPVGVASPQPDPNFPDQNVAASKVSDKVCLTWEFSEGAPDPGFYRISTDGGASWDNPQDLPWPDAYMPDSATSYHITSLFPFYDRSDGLHIVTCVMPYVAGQGYVIPAKLYHWSPDNTPNWSLIHVADPDTLAAPVGYNAIYACRTTLGEDGNGNLYVAWEEFDSLNAEPGPPEVLRADIFMAKSEDNGVTWGAPTKLTEGGTGSHRFPCIVDLSCMPTDEEMIAVTYIIDQVAGFFVQNENVATNNPVICHWVPVVAIAEPEVSPTPVRAELSARPNPFGNRTVISYALSRAGEVALVVYDASGRPVETIERGYREAGRYSVTWHSRDLAAGVYFYSLITDDASISDKLVVTH